MKTKKKKVREPQDLYIQGHHIAECTYDIRGQPSARLIGHLMGSPSARRIARFLLKAANWVDQEEKSF